MYTTNNRSVLLGVYVTWQIRVLGFVANRKYYCEKVKIQVLQGFQRLKTLPTTQDILFL